MPQRLSLKFCPITIIWIGWLILLCNFNAFSKIDRIFKQTVSNDILIYIAFIDVLGNISEHDTNHGGYDVQKK